MSEQPSSRSDTDTLRRIGKVDALIELIERDYPGRSLDARAALLDIRTALDGGDRSIKGIPYPVAPRSELRRSFNDGLRHAIMLCEGEKVNADETKHESDISYNTAIKHCIERINIDLTQPVHDERPER